jgi:hypothetical protein
MTSSEESHDTALARWRGDVTGRGGRLWRTHRRLMAGWCAVALLLIAAASQLLPSQAPDQTPTAKASSAVIVGIPGLRWNDVTPHTTPTLWRLSQRGAIGSLSVDSASNITCPLDGWLTVSAGAVATAGTRLDEAGCPAVPDTAIVPEDGSDGAYVTNQQALAEKNRNGYHGAEVGALPAAVRCNAAIGPGGAYAAARPTGRVDHYRAELPQDPDDLTQFLSRCVLSIVDLGSLSEQETERAADRRDVDEALAAIQDSLPKDALLLVAGLSDTSASQHLHTVIAAGGGFDGGRLTSAGSGREGYLQLSDLAPTAVAALDRPLPRPFSGSPAGILRDDTDPGEAVSEMIDADAEAAAQQDAIMRFLLLLTAAIIVLFAFAAAVLHRIRRGAGPVRHKPVSVWTFRAIVSGATALALTLPAVTLVDFVPWWRAGRSMLALMVSTAVIVLVLTTLVLLAPKRRSPMGLMITVSLVGVCVVATDVITGGRLQFDGIAAYSALNSAGNAGLGPLGYGVFATSLLMAAGCAAQRLQCAYRPVLIASAGCLGLFIVGSPYLGDDPAGAVALVVGVCLAAGISTGGWLTFARFAWASFAGFGLLMALAIADASRPSGQRGPLGGFVADLFGGDSGGRIRATLEADVVSIIANPLTLLLLASIVFGWVVLLRPSGGLKRAFGLYPSARAGFVGAIVAALLGGILGGNGFIPVGAASAITMPLAVVMALRVLARARVRDGRSEPAGLGMFTGLSESNASPSDEDREVAEPIAGRDDRADAPPDEMGVTVESRG